MDALGFGCLILTILIYIGSKKLYARFKTGFFSPILISPLVLVVLLTLLAVPYGHYSSGSKLLTYLLQPATVAFAVPLYKHFNMLKKHAVQIISSVLLGSVAALASSIFLAALLNVSPRTIDSLAPRSITTPIAMNVSRAIGGEPTMTAVFVIVTALVSLVIAPLILRYLPIHNRIARGLMLGTGAHGIGTSKAFEMGAIEGTIASLAMIIAAGFTLFLAPYVVPFMVQVF
ncbi:LrgB family protein [Aneurinibacillus sp. Ricciae_BoGa-3]|uniref:LrgB family protein n=1 Tax=Aneurinibacillus sp. Ricciae_BoGa-3 TaxID=3022697 RepID=UPI002341E761|nr:LrgB family protein [Aneurinibacillus sp. Ricciae_BoGa-3]WCK53580.1 LrgB family protein [Aneurinibacillus sp. Ricciae_BoGa-3]